MVYRRTSTFSRRRRPFKRFAKKRIFTRSSRRPMRGRKSLYKMTSTRIPSRVLSDYTLVKMKDTWTTRTLIGTTPAAGAYSYSNYFIHGNDLYDADALNPSTVSVGSAPTGFDQWMAFYNNFIVHESSIKITPIAYVIASSPTSFIQPFQLTVVPMVYNGVNNLANVTANLGSATIEYDEQPFCKFKVFDGALPIITNTAGVQLYTPSSVASGTGQEIFQSVSNKMSTKRILGIKDLGDMAPHDPTGPVSAGTSVKGTSGSSPGVAFQWCLEYKAITTAAGNTPANFTLPIIVFKVDIWYKAQFMNRQAILPSSNNQ